MPSAASPKAPSRRSVIRTVAWTAPVVAVATAAPAFATSVQRLSITAFTSKDVSTGQSAKYTLAVTIQNTGTTVTSGWSVTFTFDAAYGGVTSGQGAAVPGFTRTVLGSTITYTSTGVALVPGSNTFTFSTVNTGLQSTANINATVTYASLTSAPFGDTRI